MRKFFALRLAVSAICLVTGLLLIALWIRSYSCGEELYCTKSPHWHAVGIYSGAGRLVVAVHRPTAGGAQGVHYVGPYNLKYRRQGLWERQDRSIPNRWAFGSGWISDIQLQMMLPHWFLVVLVADMHRRRAASTGPEP